MDTRMEDELVASVGFVTIPSFKITDAIRVEKLVIESLGTESKYCSEASSAPSICGKNVGAEEIFLGDGSNCSSNFEGGILMGLEEKLENTNSEAGSVTDSILDSESVGLILDVASCIEAANSVEVTTGSFEIMFSSRVRHWSQPHSWFNTYGVSEVQSNAS